MKKYNFEKENSGFTLIETIITLSLFTILSIGIITIFNIYKEYGAIFPKSLYSSIIKKDHSETIEQFKNHIKQAQLIVATTSIESTLFTTNTTTLILQLRSIDDSKNILPGSYDTVIFYIDTSTSPMVFYKKVIPSPQSSRTGGTFLINNKIKNLSFIYNTSNPKDANLIEIILETSNFSQNNEIKEKSDFKIGLR